MLALKVSNLHKYYGNEHAVKGISFSVPQRSITALLGGNGAGKSTTLSIIAGLLTPSAGEVEALGINLLTNRYAALPRMNYSSPYTDLPKRLTVEQNLRVFADLYALPRAEQQINEMIELLTLKAVRNKPYGQLSAGQCTRVLLAKALLNKPDLLLLDEPSASLDPETALHIRQLLLHYRDTHGTTLFFSSHNMYEVSDLADHVLILKQGLLVAEGSPVALLERYHRNSMEEVFLDIAKPAASS